MPSLIVFHYRFTPPIWACLLAAGAMTIFLSLSYWQLERAHEKQHILSAIASGMQHSPAPWQDNAPLPQAYQPIRITGHFLPDLFLLDNQFNHHQIGFQVLSPFVLKSHDKTARPSAKKIILIDRGWVAADPTRQQLPVIATPQQTLTLHGYAYYPTKKLWRIGPDFEIKAAQITVIEHLDLSLVGNFLHKSLNPFIIRMAEDIPYGYQRNWIAISMPPERHLGYALQWLTMALITVVLLITLNLNKIKA